MAKYVLLLNWTEKGIAGIKESANRLDAVRAMLGKSGGAIESIYMTFGEYDQIAIVEAPDDATLAANNLRIASSGFVRMKTLRAFTEDEYRTIIGSL
jgi:uncharacterized protein with GYD domain